jgi:transglutaminase-like putative cysteine protease
VLLLVPVAGLAAHAIAAETILKRLGVPARIVRGSRNDEREFFDLLVNRVGASL